MTSRWASDLVIAKQLVTSVAGGAQSINVAPIYVADWWGCVIDLGTAQLALPYVLTLTWGELTADGTDIDTNKPTETLQLNMANAAIAHVTPHLGPYLKANITTTGGQVIVRLFVRNTNRQHEPADFLQQGVLFNQNGNAPAGITKFGIPPYLGAVYASAQGPAAPAAPVTIEVHGHDALTATDVRLDEIFNSSIAQLDIPRRIWLPGLLNEIWINNTTGGAVGFNVALVAAYR